MRKGVQGVCRSVEGGDEDEKKVVGYKKRKTYGRDNRGNNEHCSNIILSRERVKDRHRRGRMRDGWRVERVRDGYRIEQFTAPHTPSTNSRAIGPFIRASACSLSSHPVLGVSDPGSVGVGFRSKGEKSRPV